MREKKSKTDAFIAYTGFSNFGREGGRLIFFFVGGGGGGDSLFPPPPINPCYLQIILTVYSSPLL